jgi:hypothetical protein
MGSFSFTAEITEDRTLTLPPGSPTGRVTVAITPAVANAATSAAAIKIDLGLVKIS